MSQTRIAKQRQQTKRAEAELIELPTIPASDTSDAQATLDAIAAILMEG
jgi:hypothetical protein